MKPIALAKAVNVLSGGRLKYGWWSARFVSDSPAIFIGGCGRSGTTLLTALLSAHPQLHIGPETGIFYGNRKIPHLSHVTRLPARVVQALLKRSCCQGEFMYRLMRRLAEPLSKANWGEKTPENVFHIERIFGFFPRARFLHMIRDGRDTLCSLRHHPEYRLVNGQTVRSGITNSWSACVTNWESAVRAGLRWRGDARYYEVQYEDLVSSPEGTLRNLVEWLGYPFAPEMLEHYRRPGLANHRALAGAITNQSVGRWRDHLDPEAYQELSDRCADLMGLLSYT